MESTIIGLTGELDLNWLVATGNSLKQGTTALPARPIEPKLPDGSSLSIANSLLEIVAMPHSAEALKDQADDLTLAGHSFSQGRFFFISPSHLDAYLQLLDSLKQQRRLTLLIGEPGIGKTTLLTKLISEAPPRIKLVLCNAIKADFDSLLALINERLELSVAEDSRARRLSALQSYLNAPAIRLDSLVLLIEDAQNLSETVFEELFKLILLEQDARCPLRVILSGSPRLAQCLNEQKILRVLPADTLFLHLSPLDGPATATYIYRQLGDAGNLAPEALFPAPVIARVAHYARGLPQLINRLCEHTLEIARKTGRVTVTIELIDQAANGLEMSSRPAAPTERKPPSIYFAVPVVLASLIAALIGLPHLLPRLPLISKPGIATSATLSSSAMAPSAGQQQEPSPVTSPEAIVPQVATTVPALPPSVALRAEPPMPDVKPTTTPLSPDNASPTQAPGSATATDLVDAIAAVPVVEPPVPQAEPRALQVEPPTSGIKPTVAPEPNSISLPQAPIQKPTASRSDRVSSGKPATSNQQTRSSPPQPVVPAVQVHKTSPPRPKANPSSTRYKSVAYQKQTARPAPRSESDAHQDSTESNGWKIRK